MKKMIVFCAVSLAMQFVRADKLSPLALSIVHNPREDQQLPSGSVSVYGMRLGLVSAAHARMYGCSVSIGANADMIYPGDVGGITIAGVFNQARTAKYGAWQIASGWNIFEGEANAFQCAGFCNMAKDRFDGMQLALANISQNSFCGVQLGLVNYAKAMDGFQLGVLNMSETLSGVQLGLFNFVKSSDMEVFPIIRLGF